MSNRKRGSVDIPKVLMGLVIVVFVGIVLLIIFNKPIPGFLLFGTCNGRGDVCVEKTAGCGVNSQQEYGLRGCTESQICCRSDKTTTSSTQTDSSQLTAKEQEVLQNGVIVTLNNVPTPLVDRSIIPLKVSQPYEFKITINSQLNSPTTKAKLGKCLIYVVDSKNRNQAYNLDSSGNLIPLPITGAPVPVSCTPGQTIPLNYKPSSLDTYKTLTLYVILLKPGIDTLQDYIVQQNWLARKFFQLDVEPVIKITGMNTAWTAKDDITITCNGVSCTKIELGLIKLTGSVMDSETYDHALSRCLGGETDSGGFKPALDYISGTTVQSSGIPLNIDLGGFRIPYQQKLLYVTDSKPITVVNNKATVTIDKATMIRTFANSGAYSDLLTEDKTYLCVKATTSDTGGPYYALSDTPIKVDALPPVVDVDSGIQVVFPDPITSMNASTPYYYRQYPRIVVSGCYDWGQSGCTNYDYYIKVGNFINLNSNTADWQSGVVGLILTEGVNSLITYFASKDAANTICPLMTSNGYIRNTQPEIRFMGAGQAIVCIRLGDKVGNTRLVWKPIWSPVEMLNRILVSSLT